MWDLFIPIQIKLASQIPKTCFGREFYHVEVLYAHKLYQKSISAKYKVEAILVFFHSV